MRGKRRKERMILKNATLHIGNGEVFQGDMRIADGKIVEVGTSMGTKAALSTESMYFPALLIPEISSARRTWLFLQRTITKTRTLSRRISISGILLIPMS